MQTSLPYSVGIQYLTTSLLVVQVYQLPFDLDQAIGKPNCMIICGGTIPSGIIGIDIGTSRLVACGAREPR